MADDKLRLEGFDLSETLCKEEVNISDLEQVIINLGKAEQLLKLRIKLGFKYVHQLEAAETVFTLSMIVGDIERAQGVAVLGEQMARIRCGEGRVVEEWRKKKDNPLLYLLG